MGDGTKENPYTREDVLRLIEENGGKAEGLDLSGKVFEEGIDLSKLKLDRIILNKARLFGANLQEASLYYADLQDALLSQSDLRGADLAGARAQGVFFAGANLQEANLSGVWLQGTNLRKAKLQDTCFLSAQISQTTDFEGAEWGDYILKEERIASAGEFFAAETYRRLKIWHTNAGLYDIAGELFFREMTVKRKAMKW